MIIETQNGGKLKEVYSIESYGNSGKKVLLKIFVDVNREFTETDKNNFYECAHKLQQELQSENIACDPQTAEQAKEDKNNILALFKGQEIFVEEIPNGYGGPNDSYWKHFPWFRVTTQIGHITIGWRKRVIEIDWKDTMLKTKSRDLFPDENVTREDTYIHAGGYEKAQEYLDKIMNQSKVLTEV